MVVDDDHFIVGGAATDASGQEGECDLLLASP